MGDSGEGLVDAEARIQERLEELKQSRENAKRPVIDDPELMRKQESLRLARVEISRQLAAATHPARKNQLSAALADIERQIAEIDKQSTSSQ
jgi:hypothetical protein